MVRAIRGVLITCDAPSKAIIQRLHAKHEDIIIEVLDETHIMIQESKLQAVMQEIRNVIYRKEEEAALQINSESSDD